jgi:hypothetical protein
MSKNPPPPKWNPALDDLPDVRDGLTRAERLVLYELHLAQAEFPGRTVPTALLWGRLVERGLPHSPEQLSLLLARMGARRDPWH